MFNLVFYETPTGKRPVAEFILDLPQSLKAKAVRDIDILAERGYQPREPYSKHIQEGLFELRIQTSGDAARIFYFFFVDETIILVHGFVKKTQKTPTREIEKALRYKADYERRSSK